MQKMPVAQKRMSSANVNLKSSPDKVEEKSFARKTSSNICPPHAYLKRVTCPRRQQFYKNLQEEQTRSESAKVYHATSKYRCPRAPRSEEPDTRRDEARIAETKRNQQKKPARSREAGDRESEESNKTKLNFVVDMRQCKPPHKHRTGVVASNQINTVMTHDDEVQSHPTTMDEGVQAYCKEATKNSALYNTHEGLSENLKYGMFANKRRLSQRSFTPISSRNVFGPAQPRKGFLDKKNFERGPGHFGLSNVANARNRMRQLSITQIMHVDIKPKDANSPPPLRKNKIVDRQTKRRRDPYLKTRSYISTPAFPPPHLTHEQSILCPAMPISCHGSAMRVPSTQFHYTAYRSMPFYRITPHPSYHRHGIPVYYTNPPEIARRRSHTKHKSPNRVTSRRSKSYDKQLPYDKQVAYDNQLASPYSRTRSSQSPLTLANYVRRPNKALPSNHSTEYKQSNLKRSQHSITSSVRFQTNLPSASVMNKSSLINRNVVSVVNRTSSINRNVGSICRNRVFKPPSFRRMLSVTSTRRQNYITNPVRTTTRRPTTSLRDMSHKKLSLRDINKVHPKPSRLNTAHEPTPIRKRTYNRCLTPTITRKILSGEIPKPPGKSAVDFNNNSSANDQTTDQTDKLSSTSSSVTMHGDQHINCMSTQTLI